MIKLKWPDQPGPLWFARSYLNGSKERIGQVMPDGTVLVAGDHLEVLMGELPQIGTELIIFLKPYEREVWAEPLEIYRRRIVEEKAELDAKRQRAQEEHRIKQAERLMQRESRALVENARLKIPVRWTSGMKSVLSGLSAKSSGNGMRFNSVFHILLLEPIKEPRMIRNAHTFLCTGPGGTDGDMWTGKLAKYPDGVNGPYVAEITCRTCLKIAKRWSNLECGIAPEIVKNA